MRLEPLAGRVRWPSHLPAYDLTMPTGNVLYYGDNLDVLRQHVATESVDLIYLDPPFNSNRSYNVLFKAHSGEESQAQIEAFDDSWHWSQHAEAQFAALVAGGAPIKVSEAIEAMHGLLGPNDVLAYLVMMTARLVEMRRVLKPTGSIYLHCDPTASHYLKLVMDALFGVTNFRSEIIWKRTTAHNSAKRWGPVHDVILYYSKTQQVTWNQPRAGYDQEYLERYYKYDDGDGRLYWRADLTGAGTRDGPSGQPWKGFDPSSIGRHWSTVPEVLDRLESEGRIYWPTGGRRVPQFKRYRDELQGNPIDDVWTDIDRINPKAAERLGYQTQKPLALLERIILASSNEGDMVLDPFCGCGTTVDAAQKLHRRWVGIDITYLAVDLISKRLRHSYPETEHIFTIHGIPTDTAGALALFTENPFDFERWAVSMVDGQPNEKQVGDKGIDGRIRFHADKDKIGTVIVSVKGGQQLNPAMVHQLIGAMTDHKAAGGLLITLGTPTKGMIEVAHHSGTFEVPLTGASYPKVQIITIGQLMAHQRPDLPTAILPYIQATPKPGSVPISLFTEP